MSLPLLVIVCAIAMTLVLGVLAYCYFQLDLTQSDQPLGLPNGSVRAVLALMLLVLYGSASLFLQGKIGTTEMTTFNDLTPDQAKQMVLGKPPESFVVIQGATSATVKILGHNQAADDLGKQIVTTLATVVTTIVGFYFGAGAAAQSAATQPAGSTTPPGTPTTPPSTQTQSPTISKVSRSRAEVGGKYWIRVVGTGLDQVAAASLEGPGQASIPLEVSTAAATGAALKLTVPVGTPVGIRSLKLTDKSGNDVPVANTLEIVPTPTWPDLKSSSAS